MIRLSIALFLLTTFAAAPAFAQYNKSAGKSAPLVEVEEMLESKTDDGKTPRVRVTTKKVKKDKYGNAGGTQHDLAVDGAFEGQTIVVLQLHSFSFENARQALAAKGFGVYRYTSTPSPEELKKSLDKANQFWLISSCYGSGHVTKAHADVINDFYQKGRGVYIWGDNDPCYEEANFVAKRVLDISMEGDLYGDKVVTFRTNKNKSGLLRDHLLSTGIENLYEGITIATIQMNDAFTPFLWGSAGNIVAAFYDHDGKRAIVDGGFTRLYGKWDTAGTGRYVANAAAWLANHERFGDAVVADGFREKAKPAK